MLSRLFRHRRLFDVRLLRKICGYANNAVRVRMGTEVAVWHGLRRTNDAEEQYFRYEYWVPRARLAYYYETDVEREVAIAEYMPCNYAGGLTVFPMHDCSRCAECNKVCGTDSFLDAYPLGKGISKHAKQCEIGGCRTLLCLDCLAAGRSRICDGRCCHPNPHATRSNKRARDIQ